MTFRHRKSRRASNKGFRLTKRRLQLLDSLHSAVNAFADELATGADYQRQHAEEIREALTVVDALVEEALSRRKR